LGGDTRDKRYILLIDMFANMEGIAFPRRIGCIAMVSLIRVIRDKSRMTSRELCEKLDSIDEGQEHGARESDSY
jgi:hypothetical protein